MSKEGLVDPARALYYQMLGVIKMDRLLMAEARAILKEEFGDMAHAPALHMDQLKWFNGKLLALLRRHGLVEEVRRG